MSPSVKRCLDTQSLGFSGARSGGLCPTQLARPAFPPTEPLHVRFQHRLAREVESFLRRAADATGSERSAPLEELYHNITAAIEPAVAARLRSSGLPGPVPVRYFGLLAQFYASCAEDMPEVLLGQQTYWNKLMSADLFPAIWTALFHLWMLGGYHDLVLVDDHEDSVVDGWAVPELRHSREVETQAGDAGVAGQKLASVGLQGVAAPGLPRVASPIAAEDLDLRPPFATVTAGASDAVGRASSPADGCRGAVPGISRAFPCPSLHRASDSDGEEETVSAEQRGAAPGGTPTTRIVRGSSGSGLQVPEAPAGDQQAAGGWNAGASPTAGGRAQPGTSRTPEAAASAGEAVAEAGRARVSALSSSSKSGCASRADATARLRSRTTLDLLVAGASRLFWSDAHSGTEAFAGVFALCCSAVTSPSQLSALPASQRRQLASVVACHLLHYAPAESLRRVLACLPDLDTGAMPGPSRAAAAAPHNPMAKAFLSPGLSRIDDHAAPDPASTSSTLSPGTTAAGATSPPPTPRLHMHLGDALPPHTTPSRAVLVAPSPHTASSALTGSILSDSTTSMISPAMSRHGAGATGGVVARPRHRWRRNRSDAEDEGADKDAEDGDDDGDDDGRDGADSLVLPTVVWACVQRAAVIIGVDVDAAAEAIGDLLSDLLASGAAESGQAAANSARHMVSAAAAAAAGAAREGFVHDVVDRDAAAELAARAGQFIEEAVVHMRTLTRQDSLQRYLTGLRGLAGVPIRRAAANRLHSALHVFATPGGPVFPSPETRAVANETIHTLFPRGWAVRRIVHLACRLLHPVRAAYSLWGWSARVVGTCASATVTCADTAITVLVRWPVAITARTVWLAALLPVTALNAACACSRASSVK